MIKCFAKILCMLPVLLTAMALHAQPAKQIVVAKKGKADFRSIQGAINSLSDSSAAARVIYIKNGRYKEKLYIEKHNIVLQGQSRDKTIITEAIARDEWRCTHNEDWGVATVNISSSDIAFKNLTIINSYGFENDSARLVYCASDTSNPKHIKKITKYGHQMALRTMNGTRIKAENCRFKAYAGDTVSPWNTEDGMFYFKDCIMEGGVDFYCPRGWAYAEGCSFFANTGDAAIWHDGSRFADSKTVLVNCNFDGYKGFKLGRYHRDAQFYLINCNFSSNLADKPIYLVPTNNAIQWGERIYYYNCHKIDGDYAWFANNLHTAQNSPLPEAISAAWVFGQRWNPLNN